MELSKNVAIFVKDRNEIYWIGFLKNDIMAKAVIRSREDIETYDFLISLVNAYSNCDTWGSCDMEEKHDNCDKALQFLDKYIEIKG